ncbi:MAG TPA: hypothetical protein VM370_11620 [Candidatus Thermoplasmatota archaeon]|nr:hypothetical protein [Candidatus Thermoplasmatota archaeon]
MNEAWRWREGPRRALLVAGTLAASAALIAVKALALGPFVAAYGASVVLSLALFLAALGLLRHRLRLEWGDALLSAAPAFLVLIVALANTPMTYEAERFALALPHPDGGESQGASVLRPFEARHPTARVEWAYPSGTDAEVLSKRTRAAFADAGWRVVTSSAPSEGLSGFVQATRWGFLASCNVWDEPDARVHCLVTE